MKEESFLAISGYDPSGGAGVIADSQVSSYFGIPFCSLLTCISNQDTSSVHTVQPMDKSFMLDVAERIKEDRNIKYIKIGLIPNAELVECIIDIIESFFDDAKIILDPVIKPTGKGQLQGKTEVSAYTKLLKKAWLITPNEYELKKLSQKESIEEAIKEGMAEGKEPLSALENSGSELELDEATLKLLRRDQVETRLLELTSQPENGKQYEDLYQKKLEVPKYGNVVVIDADYLANHEFSRDKNQGKKLKDSA